MCSHLFGKGTGLGLLGDIIGGGLGFLGGSFIGAPELGLITGAALGGAGGEALGGGTLTQDLESGALGGALAGGIGGLAGVGGAAGGADAGTVGAEAASGFAGPAGDIAAGVADAPITGSDIAGVTTAAPGVVSGAGDTIAEAAPLSTTYGAAVGPSALSSAAPTADVALGTDLSTAPGAAFTTATDPLAATNATFAPQAFNPATYGLNAGDLVSPVTNPSIGDQIGNFFSPVTNAISNAGSFIASPSGKLLSTGIAGAGLLRSLMTPNNIPGESELQSLATQLGQEGAGLVGPNATAAENVAGAATGQAATLENYLTTGTLPPAVQASLTQATNSAIADLKAQYAARGESADPNQNSELAAGIASIQQNAVIQGGTLAASLYSQGASLDQLASSIYTNLTGAGTGAAQTGVGAQENVVGTNTQLNAGVNNAIANLSAALGGGAHAIVNGNTIAIPS